jgi:predicted DNA-binding transcriptional regulator YafY
MRGDQLGRQWRTIRAIGTSPNGLTVTEIAQREETGIRTIYRDLEALQAARFPLYTEKVERATRWAFINTFKFKIPPPLALKELMSIYSLLAQNPTFTEPRTAAWATGNFRDSAFADDVAKTNLTAILQQHGLENIGVCDYGQ